MNLREQLHEGQVLCAWYKVEYLLDLPHVNGILGRAQSSRRTDPGFCRESYDDAFRMMNEGWEEGARRALAHKQYEHVFARAMAPSMHFALSEESGEVQWDRVLAGETACLLEQRIEERQTRAVRIVVGNTLAAAITQDAALERAIDIAAGVAALEQLGHKLEIWTASTSVQTLRSDRLITYTIKVHSTGDMFNLAKLTWWLGHATWTRRIEFALMERMSAEHQSKTTVNYGIPVSLSAPTLTKLDLPPWDGDTLVFNTMEGNDVAKNRRMVQAAFLNILDDGRSPFDHRIAYIG